MNVNAKQGFDTRWILLKVDGYEMTPLAGETLTMLRGEVLEVVVEPPASSMLLEPSPSSLSVCDPQPVRNRTRKPNTEYLFITSCQWS